MQTALLAYTMSQIHGGKPARRLKIADFVFQWGRKRRQTAEEQLAILTSFADKQRGLEAGKHGNDR